MKKVLLFCLVSCFAFAVTEVTPNEQSLLNKLNDIKKISGVCYKKLENPSPIGDLSFFAFLSTIVLNTEAEVIATFTAFKTEAGQDCEKYKNLAQAFMTKMNTQLENLNGVATTCAQEGKQLQEKLEKLLGSGEADQQDPAIVLSMLKKIDFSKSNVCEQLAALSE